ncbi:MAG TPA: hypothetical protein DDY98_07135 [Ruminococcaceae bacterium]|nr:hypothetical protein [Oscillospiraceae bacterium]
MKKLSIVLALIMALSCFAFCAAAYEATDAPAEITICVKYVPAFEDGYHSHQIPDQYLYFSAKHGTVLTANDILANVKDAAVKSGDAYVMVIDNTEYVLNSKVFRASDNQNFVSEKLESGKEYSYVVYAAEINDVENFAQEAASELGGYDWSGVAKANVTLINQIINGFKAAVDSLANAKVESKTEKADTATTAASTSPDTGASAVAGAAIVVLALGATTAVVLRKKED